MVKIRIDNVVLVINSWSKNSYIMFVVLIRREVQNRKTLSCVSSSDLY